MGNRRHPHKCMCESQTASNPERSEESLGRTPGGSWGRRVLGPEGPGEGLSPGRETAQPPQVLVLPASTTWLALTAGCPHPPHTTPSSPFPAHFPQKVGDKSGGSRRTQRSPLRGLQLSVLGCLLLALVDLAAEPCCKENASSLPGVGPKKWSQEAQNGEGLLCLPSPLTFPCTLRGARVGTPKLVCHCRPSPWA